MSLKPHTYTIANNRLPEFLKRAGVTDLVITSADLKDPATTDLLNLVELMYAAEVEQ